MDSAAGIVWVIRETIDAVPFSQFRTGTPVCIGSPVIPVRNVVEDIQDFPVRGALGLGDLGRGGQGQGGRYQQGYPPLKRWRWGAISTA